MWLRFLRIVCILAWAGRYREFPVKFQKIHRCPSPNSFLSHGSLGDPSNHLYCFIFGRVNERIFLRSDSGCAGRKDKRSTEEFLPVNRGPPWRDNHRGRPGTEHHTSERSLAGSREWDAAEETNWALRPMEQLQSCYVDGIDRTKRVNLIGNQNYGFVKALKNFWTPISLFFGVGNFFF